MAFLDLGFSSLFSIVSMALAALVLFPLLALGVMMLRSSSRAKLKGGEGRAYAWLEHAIERWRADDRLSAAEAEQLRTELAEPTLHAVLPHLGVHLTISLFLRFPLGSIVRAGYTVGAAVTSTGRFLIGRIDRARWHRDLSIHSPLVMLLAAIPGFGAFAYIAAKPIRTHHLLIWIGLDAVLVKMPWRLYERSGLRSMIARPSRGVLGRRRVPTRVWGRADRITWGLLGAVTVLFVASLAMQIIDWAIAPTFFGWSYLYRIFDLGDEASFGNWFAVVAIFSAAVVLALIARARAATGDRFARHWAALAVIVLGMSIDEEAKLHDPGGSISTPIRERFGLDGILYYAWAFIGLGSVIALLLVFRHFIRSLPAATRLGAAVAAGLYVAGEAGTELLDGWWRTSHGTDVVYRLLTSTEEYLGLIGVVIGMGTLLAYIRQEFGAVTIDLVERTMAIVPVERDVEPRSIRPARIDQPGRAERSGREEGSHGGAAGIPVSR